MIYCSTPKVKILADSVFNGSRLTTIEVEYWRAIHSEVMTHRVFSRCFSSSRAKPLTKVLDDLSKVPVWGPNHWTLNCKGMQAKEEITDSDDIDFLQKSWENRALNAYMFVDSLKENFNLHKQIVNRLLEPFSSIKGVITATEWDNFFKLRCAEDAQPEMQDLAKAIKTALNSHEPKELKENEWHLPYIFSEEMLNISDDVIMASAARCARVSYKAFDGTTSIKKDKELFYKLVLNGHFSPLEMVAQAKVSKGKNVSNFNHNWTQLRKIVENENKYINSQTESTLQHFKRDDL